MGDSRTWLVQPPGNRYEDEQTAIHHLTAEDTANAPTFDKVWAEVESYLRGQQLWAHNASTERDALENTLNYYRIEHTPYHFHDSIHLYRRSDHAGWNHGNSLRACLYAVGLPCENHHDAGADAAMCAQIIIAHQQGVTPDWLRSDRLMAEYETHKKTVQTAENRAYQAQQLELFGEALTSTGDARNSTRANTAPTFYHKSFDTAEDGTDSVDYDIGAGKPVASAVG